MTGRVALACALAVAMSAAACKGAETRSGFRTTTSSSTTSSTTTTTAPVFAPAPSGCDASALTRVQPRSDMTEYTVVATYSDQANTVSGELRAAFTPDQDTDRVYMRMWPNGPASSAHGGKMQLANASVDDAALELKSANATTAYVDAPLVANKRVRIRVQFTVTLPTGSDDRLSRIGDNVRLGSWLPLLPWEPGVGWALEPPTSSYAEASVSPHANFDVRLTVPDGLQVFASGVERELHQWRIDAAPDWAAVIGRFNTVHGTAAGVAINVSVEPSMRDSATAYLAEVQKSMTSLVQRYGAYPWPTFNLVLTPGMRGGIEYPALVMQGPDTNARTTAHEVAHQWFYALVGNNQGRDPWLDEGLATWAEGQIDGTYASFRTRAIPADGRNRLGQPMTYWDAHRSSYYRSVYVQGLQALAALGVSAAAVDCALARYVAANAYRIATPQALADALETVAPDAAGVLARYGAQRVA